MGMSTYAYGFKPPTDERYQYMAAAWHACVAVGVDPPAEVESYFDGVAPEPTGQRVELGDATREWSAEMQHGIEVDITRLPPDVTVIRFVNSY